MALAILGIIFAVMAAITIIFLVLLFIKNGKFAQNKILFSAIGIWSVLVSSMQFSSLPTNYTGQRAIAIGVGIIPILAIVLKFVKPEKEKVARIIMAVALILSSAILYL